MEIISIIHKTINKYSGDNDSYIFGFADLNGLLHEKHSNFRYGIVIGKGLDYNIIDSIEKGPNKEYYELYKAVNTELSDLTHKVKEGLQEENILTHVIEPTIQDDYRSEDYLRTLSVNFSHKMVATRAGLGWIGKTALFISYKFGPRLRLVSLLTNYQLDFCKTPVEHSECGECNLCVEECPANAASGDHWNIGIERDQFYNAFKCREKCKELAINNAPICGICVAVCPMGNKIN